MSKEQDFKHGIGMWKRCLSSWPSHFLITALVFSGLLEFRVIKCESIKGNNKKLKSRFSEYKKKWNNWQEETSDNFWKQKTQTKHSCLVNEAIDETAFTSGIFWWNYFSFVQGLLMKGACAVEKVCSKYNYYD